MARSRNRFVVTPSVNRPRSSFPLNYSHKMTFNSGKLIPVGMVEVVAGDTIDLKLNNITRMLVPAVPVMDNCVLDIFHFWVPFRLCTKHSDDWNRIHGENVDGYWANSVEYTLANTGNCFPGYTEDENEDQVTGFYLNKVLIDSVAAYLGYPVGEYYQDSNDSLSMLPLRAYLRIWNEYFRDENLQPPLDFDEFCVNYAGNDFLKVAKLHDRFTSCLPAPQKGSSVSLFSGAGTIPVLTGTTSHDMINTLYLGSNGMSLGSNYHYDINLDASKYDSSQKVAPAGTFQNVSGASTVTSNNAIHYSNLVANLEDAIDTTTINDLRIRFAYQKALERDARGGTRFREMLRSHYGVTIPDLVVQNAEYLGGSHSILNMDTVLQTSQTDSTPLGTTGAYSNTSIKDNGFVKSFVEPGIIMTLACVRPMQTYSQGLPRLLFKTKRFDFYYPVFANIGEQPTYPKIVFVSLSLKSLAEFTNNSFV